MEFDLIKVLRESLQEIHLTEASEKEWMQLETEEQKEAYKKARKEGMSHPDAINKAKEKPKVEEKKDKTCYVCETEPAMKGSTLCKTCAKEIDRGGPADLGRMGDGKKLKKAKESKEQPKIDEKKEMGTSNCEKCNTPLSKFEEEENEGYCDHCSTMKDKNESTLGDLIKEMKVGVEGIKRCPECGGKVKIEVPEKENPHEADKKRMICTKCGYVHETTYESTLGHFVKEMKEAKTVTISKNKHEMSDGKKKYIVKVSDKGTFTQAESLPSIKSNYERQGYSVTIIDESLEEGKNNKYKCRECGKKFKINKDLLSQSMGGPECPECGGIDLKKIKESLLGHFVKGKFVALTEAEIDEKKVTCPMCQGEGKKSGRYGETESCPMCKGKMKVKKDKAKDWLKKNEAKEDQTQRMSEINGVYNLLNESVVKEALPGEEQEQVADADKDAIEDREDEEALDNEQEQEAEEALPDQKNADPNKVEEEEEIEDKKSYLGVDFSGEHYYVVTENGETKLQDAAGEVLDTAKEVGASDVQDFIRKMSEKYELNVSWETLDQYDFFKRELPQATEQEAAAAGPVGSHPSPEPPAESELPQGEATIEPEDSGPDLKPLSKEGDATVTGMEPLDDTEQTIDDGGEAEPEVTNEPSVEDFTDDEIQEEPKAEPGSKYKERKPKEDTMSRGKTPNPGRMKRESKELKEASARSVADMKALINKKLKNREGFELAKQDARDYQKILDAYLANDFKTCERIAANLDTAAREEIPRRMWGACGLEALHEPGTTRTPKPWESTIRTYLKTAEGKKILEAVAKNGVKEFVVKLGADNQVTGFEIDDKVTFIGEPVEKAGESEEADDVKSTQVEPVGQKTPKVPGDKDSEVGNEPTEPKQEEMKEFVVKVDSKNDVVGIGCKDNFTIHGHQKEVGKGKTVEESLMAKYGLSDPVPEALTPQGNNNDGALVEDDLPYLKNPEAYEGNPNYKRPDHIKPFDPKIKADADARIAQRGIKVGAKRLALPAPNNESLEESLYSKYLLNEGCSGMKKKMKNEDANDNPMFEDSRTFESACNELVREAMESLGDLNEGAEEKSKRELALKDKQIEAAEKYGVKSSEYKKASEELNQELQKKESTDIRKKVKEAIINASKWGYDRSDAGLIKERAMKKIMRRMKKNHMQEAESTLSKEDEEQEFAGQSSEEYLEKGSQNHELLPTETNKVRESKFVVVLSDDKTHDCAYFDTSEEAQRSAAQRNKQSEEGVKSGKYKHGANHIVVSHEEYINALKKAGLYTGKNEAKLNGVSSFKQVNEGDKVWVIDTYFGLKGNLFIVDHKDRYVGENIVYLLPVKPVKNYSKTHPYYAKDWVWNSHAYYDKGRGMWVFNHDKEVSNPVHDEEEPLVWEVFGKGIWVMDDPGDDADLPSPETKKMMSDITPDDYTEDITKRLYTDGRNYYSVENSMGELFATKLKGPQQFESKLNESKFQVGQMVTDINGDDEFRIIKVFPNMATALQAYPKQKENMENDFNCYRPLDKSARNRPWYLLKCTEPGVIVGPYLCAEDHTFLNESLYESKEPYDHKTWKDSRSHKSLVKGLVKEAMEIIEGLKEANGGSVAEAIEEASTFMLEGRPDASYIKKMALKKINRKMKRKAAGEATHMQEGVAGNTPQQKQAFVTLLKTLAALRMNPVGTVMVGKDLVVDLSPSGGEILIDPTGYCEMDNMQFDPSSAEQIQDIQDSGDSFRGYPTKEKKTSVTESVEIDSWELNAREGNIDLYSGEDFVDSFNFQDTCKHFMEVNNADNAAEFAKAEIDKGWVKFYSADGTELGADPIDELVDYFIEQRDAKKEQPSVEPENQQVPAAMNQPPLVGA